MIKQILPFILTLLIFFGCSTTKYVDTKKLEKFYKHNPLSWNLDECNKILDFYTSNNFNNLMFNKGPINQDVIIKALLLNSTSVQALSRKEMIEKRLSEKDYYEILNAYLTDFTSLKYDASQKKIVEADSSFNRGYSFKMYFENITDPFRPILLEDGYSYFFLENLKGEFSRVTYVTGLFVEDYFQLDGYLDAIITFSPFSNNGKRLFESKDLNNSYKLVFNGLQTEPIIIEWNLK